MVHLHSREVILPDQHRCYQQYLCDPARPPFFYAATFPDPHLDSQPTGGRFGVVLVVCVGIEMPGMLENWIETEVPVGVVNWPNKEGTRFPVLLTDGGVWSGLVPLDGRTD